MERPVGRGATGRGDHLVEGRAWPQSPHCPPSRPRPATPGGVLAGSGVKFGAAVLFHAVLCCCVRSGISIHIASVVSVAVDQSRSDGWADALAFLGGMHYVFHWEFMVLKNSDLATTQGRWDQT